ncbi:hypothetical protein [Bradyrhizobium sp. Tv2a-2]|uniref:hypothetical protein n=1 Tax=Bradyrhizobium sp. Tv2a-2 TaxID=113395 RepID=UPI0004158D1F|nr:hypothetical protein [Bradyrhizobium sp. Tv2a-2]
MGAQLSGPAGIGRLADTLIDTGTNSSLSVQNMALKSSIRSAFSVALAQFSAATTNFLANAMFLNQVGAIFQRSVKSGMR